MNIGWLCGAVGDAFSRSRCSLSVGFFSVQKHTNLRVTVLTVVAVSRTRFSSILLNNFAAKKTPTTLLFCCFCVLFEQPRIVVFSCVMINLN